ncbi:hypothetical protein ACJ6WF_32405 [Streptomyces sp. MMS24-I2-30]|uniref:hypothetical protein n=1 Tax=Streptomyces sp. MMS24-I2-30 TaxID=3351564 RepID=UPI003896A349
MAARDGDGPIKPCTGPVGYGGDAARVHLLLTENPALPYSQAGLLVPAQNLGGSARLGSRKGGAMRCCASTWGSGWTRWPTDGSTSCTGTGTVRDCFAAA